MKISESIQRIGIAMLALSVCATLAFAQDEGSPPRNDALGGGPPPGHQRPIPLIIQTLDANHDGVIDSNEIANASVALKTLDKNGDGRLTADEYLSPRLNDAKAGGPPPDHPRPISPIIQALDANHDGVIDASEIANASAALKTLDKNGDGQLTRDEFRPPRSNGLHDGPQGAPQGDRQHRPPTPPGR